MTTDPRRKMDEYGPEEMAIPEWRLIQQIGGDWAKELGAKPGQFHNSITDEIADELNIVVVDVLMGRARWGAEITNAGPICASMDAQSNISISGDDCTKCEFRLDTPWSADATERRKKCCLNYTILGIDLDHDYLPILIRAHGISSLPARQLITQLKMNRVLRGEYHRAIVNVKSVEKDTPYGKSYALHPKITELITDESKTDELKTESNRLLGAPIPLPEGRPEEETEPEPLGFTPTGVPFYSEKERQKLMATETPEGWRPSLKGGAKVGEPVPMPAETPPAKAEVNTPAKDAERIEEKKEESLDLDF